MGFSTCQSASQVSRDFAASELAPHMQHWDEKEEFPRSVLKRAAALGFGSRQLPHDH